MFEHLCHCGKWGSFGYGVSLLQGREGKWYCAEHRPGREPAKPAEPAKPVSEKPQFVTKRRDGYTLLEEGAKESAPEADLFDDSMFTPRP